MADDDLTIQLSISPEEAANLAALMEKLGLTEMKELVNISLSLLQWTVTEIAKGNLIGAVNMAENRMEVLKMAELGNVHCGGHGRLN